jgi:hypothetical protein
MQKKERVFFDTRSFCSSHSSHLTLLAVRWLSTPEGGVSKPDAAQKWVSIRFSAYSTSIFAAFRQTVRLLD